MVNEPKTQGMSRRGFLAGASAAAVAAAAAPLALNSLPPAPFVSFDLAAGPDVTAVWTLRRQRILWDIANAYRVPVHMLGPPAPTTPAEQADMDLFYERHLKLLYGVDGMDDFGLKISQADVDAYVPGYAWLQEGDGMREVSALVPASQI